jgi:hydrogenase maturation protein HypF
VHLPGRAGCGDAGLALGQAWVAAMQLCEPDLPNPPHAKETEPCV